MELSVFDDVLDVVTVCVLLEVNEGVGDCEGDDGRGKLRSTGKPLVTGFQIVEFHKCHPPAFERK